LRFAWICVIIINRKITCEVYPKMLHPIRHFNTIARHKWLVFVLAIKCGIAWRGLVHDLSKYSPEEFIPGMRYFQGTRSPNEKERELHGYSSAWLHHKGRNKHHFEYWNDVNPKTKQYEPVEMPLVYLKEMFCDRVAASKVYNGKNYTDDCALRYYQRGRGRESMHEKTAETLEMWLSCLAENGEKKACAMIRAWKRENPTKVKEEI